MLTLALALAMPLAAPPPRPTPTPFPTDPSTGRAIGAQEITPDALAASIAQHHGVLVIDVRDEASFRKETIKGAVHVPLDRLEAFLKPLARSTRLAFT